MILRQSLAIVPEIHSVDVNVGRSAIEVTARHDVADQVRLACSVAGVYYRTRVGVSSRP